MQDLTELLQNRLTATTKLLTTVLADQALCLATQQAAIYTATAIRHGGKLLLCGNGGSAAEAIHLSGELIGPFLDKTRRALPAIALGFDPSALTAIANDFTFTEVFARQLTALARPGDVLWALSTSGRSLNIRRVLETARAHQVYSILLTGAAHIEQPTCADLILTVPAYETPRIQEIHLILGHFLCEVIESLIVNNE